MELRVLCLFLLPLVYCRSAEPNPELSEHLKRIVRSENIGGYTFATLHDKESVQTKRDIITHASDTSSDKSSFSLHLASGERLRMSLKRRSIDTSGATLTEIREDGKSEVTGLQARDCFFSGPLDGAEGFASLAMCDGHLMGSVNTDKRYYEVHSLPEYTDKRSVDDVMRVLVTWQDVAHAHDGMMAGDETMKRRILDTLEAQQHDGIDIPEDEDSDDDDDSQRRSISARTVTIEIADYVDSHYLSDVKNNLGLTTTTQITDLILHKWSSAAHILGDKNWIGWDITLKLVALEIWRTNPTWYPTDPSDTLVTRMHYICEKTKPLPYDQVTLHTGSPIDANGKVGLSWTGGVCRPRWRCAALRSANTNFFTELHEFGHSLGLAHEGKMSQCASDSDPIKGFMGGNRDHFRKCYSQVLDETFTNSKKGCVHTLDNPNTVEVF